MAGATIHADEASHWDNLEARFLTKRINHSEAYSLDGACTNQAESFLARLRRMVDKLLSGVVLDDDPAPVRAAACEAVSEFHLRLTLTEGKYHQVKRMLAAVGNRVEGLHRSRIGGVALPADLAPGQWRWLSTEELVAVQAKE